MKAIYVIGCFLMYCQVLLGQQVSSGISLSKVPAVADITYEEILSNFYKHYSGRLPEGQEYHFAKKPAGWSVSIYNHLKRTYEKETFFYLFESGDYAYELPFKKLGAQEVAFNYTAALKESYFYDHNYYYGYPNWYEDAILVLETKATLTERALESLARAYDTKSISAFVGRLEAGEKHIYDERFDIKDVPKSKIEEGIIFAHKAIDTYKVLAQRNPDYDTYVGSVNLKVAAAHITPYFELTVMGLHEQAKAFLKDDLYDDFFIAVAKSLLNTCPKNAILIVGGDNDTFPLVYVQDKLGYRRDVLVVNQSLAYVPRYIRYYTTQAYGKANCTIPLQQYMRELTSFLVAFDDEKVSAKQQLEKIASETLSFYNDGYQNYYQLDGRVLTFTTLPNPITVDYIDRTQLFLIDLYLSNPDRPLQITETVVEQLFEGQTVYTGLSRQVLRSKALPEIPLDVTRLEENIRKNIIMMPPPTQRASNQVYRSFTFFLRNTYYQLAKYHYEQGAPQKAMQLLKEVFDKIPFKVVPITLIDYTIIDILLGEATLEDLRWTESAILNFLQALAQEPVTEKPSLQKYINIMLEEIIKFGKAHELEAIVLKAEALR
ncbi:MAG: hypothetical protein ACFB0B_17200 [Thermonemataceae bacterium]